MINYAQIVQSHALSFFHLSSPDLLLGLDADPASRNIPGRREIPRACRRRNLAAQVRPADHRAIERQADSPGVGRSRRRQPAARPPGCATRSSPNLPQAIAITQDAGLVQAGDRALPEEIDTFANFPSLFLGLVSPDGTIEHYDGVLRVVDAERRIVVDQLQARTPTRTSSARRWSRTAT